MADVITSPPSFRPRFPVEVCENIIDMLAGPYDEYQLMDREVRRALNQCRLVCRDWVPRCRLHLSGEIYVDSRDALQLVAEFLNTSSFHASLLHILIIRGGGPDQSWIGSVPLRLPALPHLQRLDLENVDLSQQPPQFYQVYSLLRTRSQSDHFILYVDKDHLTTRPTRVASLASALRALAVFIQPNGMYPVHTLAQVTALVKSWPHRLSRRAAFATAGTSQELLKLLPAWTHAVGLLEITTQTSLLESLGRLSQETRRVWEEICRVFTLSLVMPPTDVGIEYHVEGLGNISLNAVEDTHLVKHELWANLDNADDDALAYLVCILPYVAPCNLTCIMILVKNNWSASTRTWETVDDAILSLAQSTVTQVTVAVHSDADLPPWQTLPYKCSDEFYSQMLPKCAAKGVVSWCASQPCRLHESERWRLHTRGTLQDLLDILPAWTCPVVWWEITLRTTLLESLGEFSQETQRVWEEMSRIFALSRVVRPRDVCIDFRVEGLGRLVLSWIKDRDPTKCALWAELDNADNDALAYVVHILPSLMSCSLTLILIHVKNNWTASTEMWRTVDNVVLRFAQVSVSDLEAMVEPAVDDESYKTFPYNCEDDFCKQMLPMCAANGVIRWCGGQRCYLYNTQKWRFYWQTHGTVADLLALLPAWVFPVTFWKITLQTSLLECLEELLQETQRVWEEISRIFALSLATWPRNIHVVFHVEGLGNLELNSVRDSDPVEYGLWAYLDNADDNALAYLAHILPCVASCNLTLIRIQVKNGWPANTQTWKSVDGAILQLSQGSVSRVLVGVDPTADVPAWETLPYECEDSFCKQMLPGCVAKAITVGCASRSFWDRCRLHDPQRRVAYVRQ